MTENISGPRWVARLDARRASGDYSDLLKSIAAYYDMYDRGYKYLGPWINRSSSAAFFVPPDKEEIKRALGRPRASVHDSVHNSFVDALYNFAVQSKGKRQMINPDPASHHSAQYLAGCFSITQQGDQSFVKVYGCEEPLIVKGLQLQPGSVNFIIVRPKIGKLGTASVVNWEILFYKNSHSYMIDHVDSFLNPRYAGIM